MKIKGLHIIPIVLLLAGRMAAQLSPGDLSKAHADLEGLSNCTKCHVLGQKVSNDKCLECHKEIKSRIDGRVGYHASRDVQSKSCAACHSDHHGRNFDMVRFDEDNFKHELTGYKLEGAHKKTDCRECHKPDNIEDRSLKNLRTTFLGLEQQCLTCHTDYHQKTLSNDCAKCHTADAFTPASRFDHDKAKFGLEGKHKTVDCIECHRKEVRNGKAFQQFTGLEFGNCNSCHEDAHNNNLGANCKECHVEQSFNQTTGLKNFNHGKTHFPLKGKHRQVRCEACHNLAAEPLDIFQDRKGVRTDNCAVCHEDVHEGKFGNQCANCHDEKSFRIAGVPDNFNHNMTGFELEGKHEAVDCKKCHTHNFLDPLPHFQCSNCHEDYHDNQFAAGRVVAPDCAKCHTVDGFEVSHYTIADHNGSRFPLAGAHAATPCFACHKKDEQEWKFRNIGEKCIDCHNNVHGTEIDEKFYPGQACENCHISTGWRENHNFDHAATRFKLTGAHTRQSCGACHVTDREHDVRKFKGLPDQCFACHEDNHRQQFEVNGITDCTRCHGSENWKISRFNHNKTAFKLTGKHVGVACDKCHKEIREAGRVYIQYKFKSFECAVCHQ
ncbi:MAG: hypothetical protein KDD12_17440 [Lewinella sp.]|nr:hypothetical protein [Lewinella sp.]